MNKMELKLLEHEFIALGHKLSRAIRAYDETLWNDIYPLLMEYVEKLRNNDDK